MKILKNIIGICIAVFVSSSSLVVPAAASGFSGGLLGTDLTLTASGSPYKITSPIEIPEGVTLNVEPGVVINSVDLETLFWIQGTLNLAGSESQKIRIKGSPNQYFYLKDATQANLVIKHTLINGKNNGWLIPPTGYTSYASILIEDSEFLNIPGYNYVWYPEGAIFRRNVFKNIGGFSVGTRENDVLFENNLFLGSSNTNYFEEVWIKIWANYSSYVGVHGNEFRGQSTNVISCVIDCSGVSATGNYWGTADLAQIESKVLDSRDSLQYKATVDVTNFLTSRGSSPESSIILSEGEVDITPGEITLQGIARVGETLTAVTSGWLPTGINFSYEWMRDGAPIAGANSRQYKVISNDLGKSISVSVLASKSGLDSISKTSAETSIVAVGDFSPQVPVISGLPRAGQELQVNMNSWSNQDIIFAYQWLKDGQAIPLAKATRYLLLSSDVGHQISVMVTAVVSGQVKVELTSSEVMIEQEAAVAIPVAKPKIAATFLIKSKKMFEVFIIGANFINVQKVKLSGGSVAYKLLSNSAISFKTKKSASSKITVKTATGTVFGRTIGIN